MQQVHCIMTQNTKEVNDSLNSNYQGTDQGESRHFGLIPMSRGYAQWIDPEWIESEWDWIESDRPAQARQAKPGTRGGQLVGKKLSDDSKSGVIVWRAAAMLYGYTQDGRRYTTLTTRQFSELTGCSMQSAQRAKAAAGTVDTSKPERFLKVYEDDPVWRFKFREFLVAVAIRYLIQCGSDDTLRHTNGTIAAWSHLSEASVKRAVSRLAKIGYISLATRTVATGLGPKTLREIRLSPAFNASKVIHIENVKTDPGASKVIRQNVKTDPGGASKVIHMECVKSDPLVGNGLQESIIRKKTTTTRASACEAPPESETPASPVVVVSVSDLNQGSKEPETVTRRLEAWPISEAFEIRSTIQRISATHGTIDEGWLVGSLKRPAGTGILSRVAIVRARLNTWPEVKSRLEQNALEKKRRDDEIASEKIDRENRAQLALAEAAKAEADKQARLIQERESWPIVASQRAVSILNEAVSLGTLPLMHERQLVIQRGSKSLFKSDDTWRYNPKDERISGIIGKFNQADSGTYVRPTELKAALNGTIPTHGDSEGDLLEAITRSEISPDEKSDFLSTRRPESLDVVRGPSPRPLKGVGARPEPAKEVPSRPTGNSASQIDALKAWRSRQHPSQSNVNAPA